MIAKENFRFHPDGFVFFIAFGVVSLILSGMSTFLGWLGLIATAWCIYFFRNPVRTTPTREGLIISPADGIVSQITKMAPPSEYDMGKGKRTRISIFLNVFDVHVNRIPIKGRIKKIIYHPGAFFNASLDKASDQNERQAMIIDMADDTSIGIIQIAGLIARRIRCDVREGDDVKTAQVFGLIRFGSRVDIYLPEGSNPLVIVGQRMIAGETILADMTSNEAARVGVSS